MIGKIEKVPLREVWKNEAKDFTSWLFDNIEILGEEIDMDLTAIEKEKSVGTFSADIIAENGDGQKVVIENQLEKTDHGHLGQMITYVTNLEGKVAIWISSDPRPEHERAIEWLNEMGTDIDFYLMQVEAYKIGSSDPAPKFTVIAGPSDKAEVVGEEKKEFAERHKRRYEFWKSLLGKSKAKTSLHGNISPGIYSWVGAGAGKSGLGFNYVITYKYGAVELYIDRGKESEEENKRIFDELVAHKKEIEGIFGGELDWERLDDRRASRIRKKYTYAALNNYEKWDQLQDDMISGMINLEKALKKHIANLSI